MVAGPRVTVAPAPTLAAQFAQWAEAVARNAVATRGRFSIALPGGSVAERLLPALAAAAIAWTRVEVFLCDERCVPQDDPSSNAAALARFLLDRIRERPAVHRMRGEDADGERAAASAEAEMRAVLGPAAALDVLLLGVGEDGHVGSLFPSHAALRETVRLVVFEPASPKPPPRRLTITLPVVAAARDVVVAALGAAKAKAVQEALSDPRSTLPVALALRAARRATVYLDPEAAGLLSLPSRS